mgnify:CR=1 FL=1
MAIGDEQITHGCLGRQRAAAHRAIAIVQHFAPGKHDAGVEIKPPLPSAAVSFYVVGEFRTAVKMCHTAMNIAAAAGPSTKPFMPKVAMPPSVVMSTT